jgi:hypothetical protein
LKHRLEVDVTVAKDVESALELLEEFGEERLALEGGSKHLRPTRC